ncbi:MAG: tetratricopeptide repeat protein [Chthoniobacterales bacterium]
MIHVGHHPPTAGISARIAGVIFAAVLALRFLALSRSMSIAALPGGGDIAFYTHWAQRILAGELTDGRAFYALPLYAFWLAGLFAIFGVGAFVPALLQCAADAGTAVFLYQITARLLQETQVLVTAETGGGRRGRGVPFGQIAGVVAAAGWAFFLPAQAFAIVLMPTTLGVFVYWFLVSRIILRAEPPGKGTSLCWGLLLGVTAMAVATILFLLPLLLAALVWRWNSSPGRTWKISVVRAAFLILGVAAGTSPCFLHNRFVAKDSVFLSAHSGINFWIGNNADANGYPHFGGLRAGQAEMLEDSVAQAEKAAGKPLQRGEVSAYWSGKAQAYIAGDVVGWFRLLGRKIWNFWNAFEYDDLSVFSNLREQGVIFPGIRFGLVSALALAAIPILSFRLSASRWILAAIGLQMVSLLPVFITERYRLAAVPGLLIVAVLGISQFWEFCARRQIRMSVVYGLLLIASTALISWSPTDPALWALDPYNAGRGALQANDLPLAERKLALAHAYVPDNPEINLALGNLWLAEGDRERARQSYRDALAVQPQHKSALNNLGVMALEDRDFLTAQDYLQRSLRADPENGKSHYLLAKTFLGLGDRDRARLEIERALQLNPAQVEFLELQKELQ